MTESTKGKEVYSSTGICDNRANVNVTAVSAPIEEEDDLGASVKSGTLCRRNGCRTVFVSDDVNRIGEGEGTVCTYHSAPVRLDVPFRVLD
jgi:hypothetical protein